MAGLLLGMGHMDVTAGKGSGQMGSHVPTQLLVFGSPKDSATTAEPTKTALCPRLARKAAACPTAFLCQKLSSRHPGVGPLLPFCLPQT